jgi:heat shock protein HtpX
MFRNSALVAVSTGLLRLMSKSEAEAVLGHEVSHVANGDMITLTLIQGVVNTFVLFLARVISSQFERGRFMIYMALQMVFGIFASMIVAWFSRRREFRADEGGAELESSAAMASALNRLRSMRDAPSQLPDNLTAFGIRGEGMLKLMATHPPLEERIARLQSRG